MKGNFHLRFAYKQTSNKTMLLPLHGIFPISMSYHQRLAN